MGKKNSNETKLIPVGRNHFAVIDSDLFDPLSAHRWTLAPNGHAFTKINGKVVYMHRLILDVPANLETDHRNGKPLDNRIANLRICTRSQNMAHKRLAKNNKLGYKGVTIWGRKTKRYLASICKDGKITHIGSFDDPVSAARAYDAAAREIHGEFAWLNFPNEK